MPLAGLYCCSFSEKVPLANLLAALSLFLVAYLLVLLQKAGSSGFRPREEVVDFLPLLCKGNIKHQFLIPQGAW